MLNLNCVICADLFTQSDNVDVTKCGHMFHVHCLQQWHQRSKTCPQCRSKCYGANSIFRVYFNCANLDVSQIDVGSMQEQLDTALLQLKLKEQELRKSKEDYTKLKADAESEKQKVLVLDQLLEKKCFTIQSYAEQIKILKQDAKLVADLRKEIKALKEQVETCRFINSLVNITKMEADELLQQEKDPRKLCVWVTTLRKELRTSDAKKTEMRNALRDAQSDLRKETALKKKREERISMLESENYRLMEQLKNVEDEAKAASSKQQNNFASTSSAATAAAANKPLDLIKHDLERPSLSPTIKENIKKIEDSNSPYFNIKSSSIGLSSLFIRNYDVDATTTTNLGTNKCTSTAAAAQKRKHIVPATTTSSLVTYKLSPIKPSTSNAKAANTNTDCLRKTSSDLSEKYSIFKKPRFALPASTASTSDFVYNGFGGSHKVSAFPPQSTIINLIADEVPQVPRKAKKTVDLNSRLKSGGIKNFKINSKNSS